MLAFEKRLPDAWLDEPPATWNLGFALGEMHGRVLGLVGLGGIGTRVAHLAHAFGMNVVVARRRAVPSGIDGVEVAPLHDVLAAAEHLVLAAPATAATRHLLDTDAFARMRPGVHVVNVGRGALIDQDALLVALTDGTVACASLDVCEPEPLPAGHWMWSHPGVRLSPHISWSSPHGLGRIMAGFIDNLHRYAAGDSLRHVVDPVERY
jgi:phosphoglycerate dehydrogenase-like enzyme